MISDVGGPIASSTTFYYNLGEIGSSNSFIPTNSFGPGAHDVSKLVQSWNPEHLIAVGDLAYNVGASTLVDASIGQYYNYLIAPYPSPAYTKDPYLTIDGKPVQSGQKKWPYNLYNFPAGFPNPINGKAGGSSSGRNRFWPSLGNHDYGLEVGYGQPGVTPYSISGKPTGKPIGPSSTSSLRSSIDYFLPFLENPDLLGKDKTRLNIGAVDKTGNRGTYYSIKLGGSDQDPLVEVFQLDSERLLVNAGYEEWNSAETNGMKTPVYKAGTKEIIRYDNKVNGEDVNLDYDPTRPFDPKNPKTKPRDQTTNAPNNGFEQYQWLRQSLLASTAKWKIITAHHPIYASGRWSDTQPDTHMSNPALQRLLNALPKGSFHAFHGGENHFYERVLESQPGGIGLGIPFLVNGNSGRNLERKIQIPYGGSVYNPPVGGYRRNDLSAPPQNPNDKALKAKALLNSGPVIAGTSGLAGTANGTSGNYANGLYGYGFGAFKVDAKEDYLLFHYHETAIVDPAIANHLESGIFPEAGFKGTTISDWIPNNKKGSKKSFNVTDDVARFKLSITNGTVKAVTLLAGGQDYMASKNGNHVVKGFNIYGNNVDILKPWLDTAQVDLTFQAGSLTAVKLTHGGKGYELAVKAAAENNNATTTDSFKDRDQDLIVSLNYNIDESQYGVRDQGLYNDWYMITETQPSIKLYGQPGQAGILEVQMLAKGDEAQKLLSGGLKPTTGYSGQAQQSFSPVAQNGNFSLFDNDKLIASGKLNQGTWLGRIDSIPSSKTLLRYKFDGDPISSYNVNFKASQGSISPTIIPPKNADQTALRSLHGSLNAAAPSTPFGTTRLSATDEVLAMLSRQDSAIIPA